MIVIGISALVGGNYTKQVVHDHLIWPEVCQVGSTEGPALRGFLLVWEAAGRGRWRDARSH
jgi:hypothetical protein